MFGLPMVPRLLTQLFKKPPTNLFPAKHLPPSVTDFLKAVGEGKAQLVAPVPAPTRFKGKLAYDRTKCTGCAMCAKVCPSNIIEVHKEQKYITVFVGHCIQCEQCCEACPTNCLSMSSDFLTASTDRFAPTLILE
jgi:ferredoxin